MPRHKQRNLLLSKRLFIKTNHTPVVNMPESTGQIEWRTPNCCETNLSGSGIKKASGRVVGPLSLLFLNCTVLEWTDQKRHK